MAPRRQGVKVFKDGSQQFLNKEFSERMERETARVLGMSREEKRTASITHFRKFNDKRKIRYDRVRGRWFGLFAF